MHPRLTGLLVACGLAASASAAPAEAPGRAERPSFVLILADDLGWTDAGFMGSRYYETPGLDRLAREGMVFTHAYANAANCAPTRACLMSGQYTPRHGVYTVDSSARGDARLRRLVPTPNTVTLADDVVTVAEALKAAGYATAHMGKWHLGKDPRTQGFDVNVAGNQAGHPRSYFSPYRNPDLPDGPKGEYLTDRLTDEAVAFIEKNRDRPFFLYLPHYAVHTPIQSKPDKAARYGDKAPSRGHDNPKYAGMIDSLDEGVGRVLDALDRLGLAERTVVLFTSDNGGVKGITSMEPLRGGKGSYYEGGIREPTAVRWTKTIRAGSVCETPIISLDLYPTLLELAGAKPPAGVRLDGVSLVPLLRGGTIPERPLFWHFPVYLQGTMAGARDPHFRTRPGSAVRLGDWKLIEYFEDGALELYNLREDAGEARNLAAEQPEKARELHAILKAWRAETKAPVPTEPNPAYQPDAKPAERKGNKKP